MSDVQTNGNHAAEETVAPTLTRQQRRALDAEARKAKREAEAAKKPPAEPQEIPLFSLEWFNNSIAIHEAIMRQHHAAMTATQEYANWQVAYGQVEMLKSQRDVLLQQQQAKP